MKLFISYTTRDQHIDKNYLSKIYLFLSTQGETYIDLLHNDSDNKQERVKEELMCSDVLVLINSESVKKSKWVNWEIEMAEINSIPMVILTPDFTLSDFIYKLRSISGNRKRLTRTSTTDLLTQRLNLSSVLLIDSAAN